MAVAADSRVPKPKTLRLALRSAALGFAAAVFFAGYLKIVDPRPGSAAEICSGLASLIICPSSLLFFWVIDAEPGTSGFVVVWVMTAILNAGLYGVVGGLIGSLSSRRAQPDRGQ
jgi:hypothetical protein